MMELYRHACKYLFNLLRSYTYAQIHDLYRTAEYIQDAKVRARCRATLTKYSNFRFKVHPAPVFSVSIPSCFGVRRSILTRIIWQILCKCHIPYDAKRRLNSDIKYSFTANPPVGDILCNSRRWIKLWNINHIWPCTCQTMCSRLGIEMNSHNTAVVDGNKHIHTFMHMCDGGYSDVFSMDLKDTCEPDIEHLVETIPASLCEGLYRIKQFVCDLRQKKTSDFTYICDAGLTNFTIPTKDILSAAILRSITSLGLPVDQKCVHLITQLSNSVTAFPSNPLCKASRVYACKRLIGENAVTFFCDKNNGAGTVCCPTIAWHTMRAKLWDNIDYKHSTLSTTELYNQHLHAFTAGKWDKFSRFKQKGDPYSKAFIQPKNKDLGKWVATHTVVLLALFETNSSTRMPGSKFMSYSYNL